MKKLIVLCLLLAGCSPTCNMTQSGCAEMCKPRMVDRYNDQDGCVCSTILIEKKP